MYRNFIAQADLYCDNCRNDIPKGDWYYETDDDALCSNCMEALNAKAEMAPETV